VVAKTGYAEVLKAQGRFDEALNIYEEIRRSHPEDVVAKTGYAEVLKAQGRFDEALKIYEEIRRSHPENVVAKTGYAEVLKAQGRFDEALNIYEEIRRSHPEDVIARNGLVGILLVLGRYDEALDKLPKGDPATLQDWIGYHIRGMIMLKKGNLTEAVKIFEKGVNEDLIPASKEYFRSALAIARLRQGEFRRACETLDDVTTPSLQPAINILRVHAFGEQKMFQQADNAFRDYERVSINKVFAGYQKAGILELVAEVKGRYVTSRVHNKPDSWLFDREEEMLLALAP
ncbi:MAG TPA: tetratricopeptide repeat protein, partial [Pyrinomonadaceae bacterium]|nr:tetratricopeptide repeat protein [Pyrinomonadaceae bacterium]